MARSHHRKKHKAHVQQFRHRGDVVEHPVKGNTAITFLIIGAIVGFLICYFVTEGTLIWSLAGLLTGALAGFLLGRSIDRKP